MNKLLIFGYGYTSKHLVKILPENYYFYASSRSIVQEKLENGDFFVFNGKDLDNKVNINEVTHILVSIPPVNGSDVVFEVLSEQIKSAKNLKWIGYLSATSVYGDHHGNWVDENSELRSIKGDSKNGIDRIHAENKWLSLATDGLCINIFRIAGIYGDGRSFLDKVLDGSAQVVTKQGQYFSRIHVSDIASAILLGMENFKPGIYNLADDMPSKPEDPYLYAYKKLGKDIPRIYDVSEFELSPMMKYFYSQSKKVSNKKVKEELGLKLEYDNYMKYVDEKIR